MNMRTVSGGDSSSECRNLRIATRAKIDILYALLQYLQLQACITALTHDNDRRLGRLQKTCSTILIIA